jgi:hypothetical protein
MVIGLAGYKGSGKTLAAQYLSNEHGFQVHKFAVPVKAIKNPAEPVVVEDVRFESEAAIIRKIGGCVVWIDRPGAQGNSAGVSDGFAFETDATIVNDGIPEQLYGRLYDLIIRSMI